MFTRINIKDFNENAFELIGNEWMLITAGNVESFNTMTASWGGMGVLWNLNVATIYIRPHRYTYEFTEKNDFFTLCFFDKKDKKILSYCGSHSGRDVNKVKETGLKPFETGLKNIAFEQSRLIVECRKIYSDFLKDDCFIDRETSSKHYRLNDFHKFYIGEILNIYKRD